MTGHATQWLFELGGLEDSYGSEPWPVIEAGYRELISEVALACLTDEHDAEVRCVLGLALGGYLDLVAAKLPQHGCPVPALGTQDLSEIAKATLSELAAAVALGIDLEDDDVEPGLSVVFTSTLWWFQYAPGCSEALDPDDRELLDYVRGIDGEDSAKDRCLALWEAGGLQYDLPECLWQGDVSASFLCASAERESDGGGLAAMSSSDEGGYVRNETRRLVSQLRSGDAEQRRQAAVSLGALASTTADARRVLGEEGALFALAAAESADPSPMDRAGHLWAQWFGGT